MGKKRPRTQEESFKDAIRGAKKAGDRGGLEAARRMYADWLESEGRGLEAAQRRAEAGVSRMRYQVRKKSDGMLVWEGGKLGNAKAAARNLCRGFEWTREFGSRLTFDDGMYADLEIVAVELIEREVGRVAVAPAEKKRGG